MASQLIPNRAVFHAVVWTEAAAQSQGDVEIALKEWLGVPALWGGAHHLLLTPSGVDAKETLLADVPEDQVRVIGLRTPISELKKASLDFEQYCAATVELGVRQLRGRLPSQTQLAEDEELTLGVLDQVGIEATNAALDCFEEARANSDTVQWHAHPLPDGTAYYGPSLVQLAEKHLINLGVDPSRALWICSVTEAHPPGPDGEEEQEEASIPQGLDLVLACRVAHRWMRASAEGEPPEEHRCLNVGLQARPHLQTHGLVMFQGAAPVLDLGESTEDLQAALAPSLLAEPLSLHERAGVLLHRHLTVRALNTHRSDTAQNLTDAATRIERFCAKTPWGTPAAVVEDGVVFDHRSGAVCFDPYDWEIQIVEREAWGEGELGAWQAARDYFLEPLHMPWQVDRPCHARILLSPTKVLLRGEHYYTNLKNSPPLDRLEETLDRLREVIDLLQDALKDWGSFEEWRLLLALVDQVRNAALQLAWFERRASQLRPFREFEEVKNVADDLHRSVCLLLDSTTLAYYAILASRKEEVDFGSIKEHAARVIELATPLVKGIRDRLNGNWRTDRFQPHLAAVKLIRRWREADHPGENALVALHALERVPDGTEQLVAVGIGWGGIELPLALRQVSKLLAGPAVQAFAAHFSKYARAGSRVPVLAALTDGAEERIAPGSLVVLFDDNSLTGGTLQSVAEFLVREYDAKILGACITRLSGERRYDQMRMKGRGGLLNPALLGNDEGRLVFGQLGETPFSRAWSREIYKNPIGVFSLAKRRILELLFSNSSADRFDREGF